MQIIYSFSFPFFLLGSPSSAGGCWNEVAKVFSLHIYTNDVKFGKVPKKKNQLDPQQERQSKHRISVFKAFIEKNICFQFLVFTAFFFCKREITMWTFPHL